MIGKRCVTGSGPSRMYCSVIFNHYPFRSGSAPPPQLINTALASQHYQGHCQEKVFKINILADALGLQYEPLLNIKMF
jgi:hypothetical protein